MNKYLEEAKAMLPHLQEMQQQIHRFGGIRYDLRPSADLIIRKLKEIGLEPQEIIDCGIVATVGGKKPGKTVLLRADYDALPQDEITGLP